MSLVRWLVIATAMLVGAPALAQTPDATVRIIGTALSGRPTLLSYLGKHPIPVTVEGLVSRLNEANTCGKEVWPVPDPNKPCAIVAYYLVNKDETSFTPQLLFRAIYFVTHPDNPAETTLRIIDLDGRVRSFSNEKLDEPLRPMRVPNSCKRSFDLALTKKVKKCRRVDALYIPFGIIGYIENEEQKIMTGNVKDAFFTVALSPEDLKSPGLPSEGP